MRYVQSAIIVCEVSPQSLSRGSNCQICARRLDFDDEGIDAVALLRDFSDFLPEFVDPMSRPDGL